jgi:hypothetical protein
LIEPCDQQKRQNYRDFNLYNLILALLLSIWLPSREHGQTLLPAPEIA